MIMMLTLLLTALWIISLDPVAYRLTFLEHSMLLQTLQIVLLMGYVIVLKEMVSSFKKMKQKSKLNQAKMVRHEYRRHLQNVQALLYVEAFDEVTDYASALENELKFM